MVNLIKKGQLILANPDKPKFLKRHVKQNQDSWEETKAQERLQLLQVSKASVGENLTTFWIYFTLLRVIVYMGLSETCQERQI